MDNGKKEKRRSNPRDRANVFSFITFAYTFGLFKRGIEGKLEENDVYEIPDDCESKRCGDKTEQEWKQTKRLIALLWRRFGLRYSVLTGASLVWTLISSILQPYAMSKFISYFQKNQSKISRNDAYFYAAIVMFLSVFHCFWAHNYFMLECKLELQIKASLTSLIYRKVLRLRPGELTETGMGNIVTILTKDVRTVAHNIWTLSSIIVAGVQTVAIFYLMYARMGPPSMIAVGMLCSGLILQAILSKLVTKMRLSIGKRSDGRLQLTQEALSAIRTIKMYTWEAFFQRRIYEARKVDYQQQAFDIKSGFDIATKDNRPVTYEEASEKRDATFNLYTILVGVSAVLALIKSYSLLSYCRKASVNIHQAMCHSIINSLMSFLDTHFIGNILNRFSYDLDVIDEQFPFIFMEFFRGFISIGGILILIATVNWVFLLLALGFFLILFAAKMIYMPTGRALKRLEAMTRSPLVGHLNASVEGLTTIRAYRAEEVLKDEFDKHQDLANSTFYMVATTKRAFGYVMDFSGSLFAIFIILILLFVDMHTSVGNVGLAITQVFTLTGSLQWVVRLWADLENCMTSVERVLEYTDVRQEDKSGGAVNGWPRDGAIAYRDVSLAYGAGSSPVLRHLTFSVGAGEKIGVVGRTGAGKSSIISTLFRLYDYEGTIAIDDVDIGSVSVDFLRKRISIIPQDPVIFEGTVRDNVDPYRAHPDGDIWKALERVGVRDLVPRLDEAILDLRLSTGQKQLVSVARAMIRKNRIVVLDEATANMDGGTDGLVHALIKEHFADCTVIMIAHRLSSILDCDRVMVMDKGGIAEFDRPGALLGNKDGLFYAMRHRQDDIES